MRFTQAESRVHLHVRTCVPLFCIWGTAGFGILVLCQIWYVDRGHAGYEHVTPTRVVRVTQLMDGIPICTCTPPFSTSGTAERIALNLVWFKTNWLSILHKLRVSISTRAYEHISFWYLRSGWMDCAEIWCMIGDQ